MQQNLSDFVDHAQMSGRDIPSFVQRRLERFLGCGILAKGFARFVCHSCQRQCLVPLSCKVRGLCPSCGGRRMAEAAAHLVDHVLPEVPVRQWVLSIPIRLRYFLAYDAALCGRVLGAFIAEVFRGYRWRARAELGLGSVSLARCGSVTFVQQADSGLKLNVHFHALLLDGVFVHDQGSMNPPRFFALPAPGDDEVLRVAIKIRKKVLRILEQAGHSLGEAEAFDEFAEREPVLAQLCAASLTNKVLVGHQAGQPVMKLRGPPKSTLTLTGRRCANVGGFSLHANTKVEASDRKGLEKLCRYVARWDACGGL